MTFSAFEGICPTCNRGQEMESPKDLCACGQYKYFYQAKCAMCATQALTPSPVSVDAKVCTRKHLDEATGAECIQRFIERDGC